MLGVVTLLAATVQAANSTTAISMGALKLFIVADPAKFCKCTMSAKTPLSAQPKRGVPDFPLPR